jgi:hypothetical protein
MGKDRFYRLGLLPTIFPVFYFVQDAMVAPLFDLLVDDCLDDKTDVKMEIFSDMKEDLQEG